MNGLFLDYHYKENSFWIKYNTMQNSNLNQRYKVILLFNVDRVYDRQIIKGIGHFLQLFDINWSVYLFESVRNNLSYTLPKGYDAVIVNYDDPDLVNLANNSGLPQIGVGASCHNLADYPKTPYVAANNHLIIEQAFTHLYNKGIKNFAFYSMPLNDKCRWVGEREISFKKIMAEKGLNGIIYSGDTVTLDNWLTVQAKLAEWISSLPKNTGIIAVNDIRARQILQVCEATGIKVPEQLCVIGIDNDDTVNCLSNIPLSTIVQGTEEMGYKAAELLHKSFNGIDIGLPRILIDPKEVQGRRSTDYKSLTDPLVMQAMHFIRNNACKGIKTQQVLEEVQISRSNLELRFKKEMNKTIHQVIHDEKFEKSKYLLKNSPLSINEIYQLCGYPSLQYFYFLFNKNYKLTPKEYREQ